MEQDVSSLHEQREQMLKDRERYSKVSELERKVQTENNRLE